MANFFDEVGRSCRKQVLLLIVQLSVDGRKKMPLQY